MLDDVSLGIAFALWRLTGEDSAYTAHNHSRLSVILYRVKVPNCASIVGSLWSMDTVHQVLFPRTENDEQCELAISNCA